MLYVVNYKGRQVQAGAPLSTVGHRTLVFEDGAFANLESGHSSGSVRFFSPGDAGYIEPGQKLGREITVVNVGDDGGISVNQGSAPDKRGIQVGEGNIQFNRF